MPPDTDTQEDAVAGQPPPVARPMAPPQPAPIIPGPNGTYQQGGLTFTRPSAVRRAPQGFDSPSYQRRVEQEQMQIMRQAKNVQQAEKDVSSARRMLGLLKADREIAAGAPPEKAIYQNLHLLTTPGTASGNNAFRTMAPVPKPYMANFNANGENVPAVVTPGPGGQQRTQFVPRSAMPQTEFKASIEEIAPGVKAAKLGPNHYQLLDRPNVRGTPTQLEKVQQEIWRGNLSALQRAKAKTPIPEEQQRIQTQIDKLERQMLQAAEPKEDKPLTKAQAQEFLKQAGGDRDKARKLARDAGHTF